MNNYLEKKKIGIITHYYNNSNYGGSLQAYALTKAVSSLGYDVEQICYDIHSKPYKKKSKIKRLFKALNIKRTIQYLKLKKIFNMLRPRFEKISKFNQEKTAHSENKYNKTNINECSNQYDIFITGSDQVWNLDWYHPALFLDFVPSSKTKISYAASMGTSRLDEQQRSIIKEHLMDFKAVSVRENDMVELLSELSPACVEWVLDPTLLLDRNEWDGICSDRMIDKPYVFCYFLGEDQEYRRLATEYAREHNLCVVTLPYLSGSYKSKDNKFGDARIIEADPGDFVSLVKNADYIFTDSFHATVFSYIYEKEFVTFQRSKFVNMQSRNTSLLRLFDLEERFLNSPDMVSLKYINNLAKIDYSCPNNAFLQIKEFSIDFLKKNIQGNQQ